jgi:magnesium transporter
MRSWSRDAKSSPGAAPGVELDEITSLPSGPERVWLTCIDYSPGEVLIQEIEDLPDFLSHHRPEWSCVRWINVAGLSDMGVIHALATKYEIHPLAVEDVLHIPQRPKVEPYGGEDSEWRARLFILLRTVRLQEGILRSEQVSIFLGHKTVLTFQETPNDTWDPIRQRLATKGSRLRSNDASFLVYSLLDVIVDHCFPILEHYGDRLEDLETLILEQTRYNGSGDIHQIKRDFLQMRRIAWPMRDVVSALQRESHECLSETTRIYLRDLYDHVIQIIEVIETYRETASDLTDTYVSSVSNRMNEVMKVLTVIGTIFIPLTFLAGVYGMNFRHFPELSQAWAYPAFWAVCVGLAGVMLWFFRRRNWL